MITCLKIKKEKGELAKRKLADLNALNNNREISSKGNFLYFPINARYKEKVNLLKIGKIVQWPAKLKKKRVKNFTDILKGKLTKEEIKHLRTSYDLFGEVAVIEIPKELEKKEKIIGAALLKFYPNLKAVFKKAGVVSGIYRVRPLKLLAGKGGTETTYKESGCTFKFDVAKVFFTERLGTERLRIASQVMPNEIIVDMFAGVGPFSIVIAKKQPKVKTIYAVDINPDAVKYLKENIILNKVSDKVVPIEGDARKVARKLKNVADRVIMNLPKTSENFFPEAIEVLKKKGIIHFYTFAESKTEVISNIQTAIGNVNYKILVVKKVRPYSPLLYNFVADILVRKVNK